MYSAKSWKVILAELQSENRSTFKHFLEHIKSLVGGRLTRPSPGAAGTLARYLPSRDSTTASPIQGWGAPPFQLPETSPLSNRAKRWSQCDGARLTVIVMSRAAATLWRVVSVALVPPASRRATAA